MVSRGAVLLSLLISASCVTQGDDGQRGSDAAGGKADDAQAPDDIPLRDLAHVEQLVDGLLETSFPELADVNVRISTTSSEIAYFVSQPDFKSLLNPFKQRAYVVRASPRLFTHDGSLPDLSEHAAEAILAHELCHTVDYERGLKNLVKAAWTQLGGDAEVRAERRTDLEAIQRGFAGGLAEYRRWIYPTLPEEAAQRKREVYFTPEEISAIVAALDENPALLDIWMRDPPLSLEDIQRDAANPPSAGIDDAMPCSEGIDEVLLEGAITARVCGNDSHHYAIDGVGVVVVEHSGGITLEAYSSAGEMVAGALEQPGESLLAMPCPLQNCGPDEYSTSVSIRGEGVYSIRFETTP